ncbi:SurA N-terminal domain-containing protein [Paraferrimonas haliotis]|uniref:Periplasmic chaperone PpiD n=1 Tax=Paraferrimonas haliotis TaxID=2013866 RepID=A0AA37WX39_9GAMM|nr:SurA N-terminal domain-containing protein [Paraferrimonas haliotis]GLS84198.1 peptidylprolyl isomerase [Paraferrimonas haliotis]
MLERIREGAQGPAAKIILILIILSFAVAGVGNYLTGSNEVVVAKVNDVTINAQSLEQAYQNERARLENQLGDMFDSLAADPNYLESIKSGVLDRLVTKTVLEEAARDYGLTVSDDMVRDTIRSMEEFKIDGRFNNERYLALIRQIGMNPNTFSELIRTDLIRTQLVSAITNSEFVLPGESQALANLMAQTRDVSYTLIDAEPLKADIDVSDEQINKYYQDNLFQFNAPELISLEYVELNAADLADGMAVTDEEVQQYYQDNLNQYVTPEKRLAAHILISNDTDNAEQKAQDIYAKLQAGEDFAALAKAESDDSFSGQNGGQLDWFEKGVMTPDFDKALFETAKGEYSSVFKSDFGYQIVKVLDVQERAQASIEQVKEDVIAELKQDKAANNFFALQQQLADISYEVPDTLTEAAQAIDAEIKTTPLFSRNNAPAPFNSADVLAIAFSGEVLDERMNSEVVELGNNHVMVMRVKQHQQAGTMPLEEVSEPIKQQLLREQAIAKANILASSIAEQVRQGVPTMEQFEEHKALARFGTDVDNAIVNKAFQMGLVDGKPAVDTVELANGVAVIQVTQINDEATDDAQMISAVAERIQNQLIESEYNGIVGVLKAKAAISYPVQAQ